MRQALRAPTVTIVAGLGALCALLCAPSRALAQPWEVNGLRGGRYVGSAAPPSSTPRAVLGLGYAHTEGVIDGSDRHERAFSELGVGYAPWAALQLALELEARYDAHRSDVSGKDQGGAFASAIGTRHALALTRALWLAANTRVRFPPASTASRGLRAASPELGLLGTYLLFDGRSELSLALGYRFDRSTETVRAPASLSPGDRLAAAISRYDQALLGALFAHPLGPVLTSLEWSWDVALGSSAPAAIRSPMRLRLAAQTQLGKRCLPGLELGVSPSARPALDRGVRIEPRLWLAATLGVALDPRRPPPPKAPPRPRPEPPEEPAPALLELRVVDPAGAPLAGARVSLATEPERAAGVGRAAPDLDAHEHDAAPVQGEPEPARTHALDAREPGREQRVETDDAGLAQLTLAPGEARYLRVEKDGFLPRTVELAPPSGPSRETVTLERDLPEGEIKGKVRSLRGGKPVRAQVIVEPLGIAVDTDSEGDFVIDVPPGPYRLEIRAPGYEPQQRDAHVERLGVTILVVDLRRAPK